MSEGYRVCHECEEFVDPEEFGDESDPRCDDCREFEKTPLQIAEAAGLPEKTSCLCGRSVERTLDRLDNGSGDVVVIWDCGRCPRTRFDHLDYDREDILETDWRKVPR